MDYSKFNQEKRDELLKQTLPTDKIKFIEKYALHASTDLKWKTTKNNTPARLYFSHKFLVNNYILEIIFRKYQLCFAKLKYFRANIHKFEPYKYHPDQEFIKVELWDVEFFKHIKSGKFIDLRYLQQITEIEIFEELINQLDNF